MKLSMWMIANRLSSLDMDLDIKEDAPVILKSARRVYATNCVHVYEEGDSVVCNGEGNIIRIQNMDVVQGFEIIQSVFDYFADWDDEIIHRIREKDYQKVIDLCWQVFQNPIILQDGNSRVLGLTRQYPPDALDDEWAYLSTYGFSSLSAMQQMKYDYGNIEFWRHSAQPFEFSSGRLLNLGGLSYCLYCNDAVCGRITVLEHERKLNTGDLQLLDLMAAMLEPSLGQIYYENVLNNTNVFYNILFKRPYDKAQLDSQLEYQQWNSGDTFYLTLVEVLDLPGHKLQEQNVEMLMQIILQQASDCIIVKKMPCILLLSTRNLGTDAGMRSFFDSLGARNPIRVGFSLPCRGIENASYLYDQAAYALSSGKFIAPEEKYFDFFDYAINYIIDSDSLANSVRACMPTLIKLWEMQQLNGDELFHTLKVFLDNERSVSRTSIALYTHRNTVLYRIRKIQEILKRDLDDAYTRQYCQLSIRILELYRQKNNRL